MPFDHRWFYGDAMFIIDPWLWLALAPRMGSRAAAALRGRAPCADCRGCEYRRDDVNRAARA